jgi:NAD(P)H-dependent FMN reductase
VKRLLLNGSPRGKDGNSRRILSWIAEGMQQAGIATPPTVDLAPDPTLASHLEAFVSADEIVFAFPLYIDAMPGIVKTFLEALATADPAVLRGKRVAFVIQSGFPEGIHTEVLGRYLARLCGRLGFQHLGTLRRGGMESIRTLSPRQLARVAACFRAAGKELGERGAFSSELLSRTAGPRRFGPLVRMVLRLLIRTGLLNRYWNTLLKQHGAFAHRFDTPYASRAS